jgi:hypothetical protein
MKKEFQEYRPRLTSDEYEFIKQYRDVTFNRTMLELK